MAVSVWVKTSLGIELPLPIGLVLGNGQWKPSAPMLIIANLLPLFPGDRTPVAFTFTPLLGEWQIDDVYVDPRRSQVGLSVRAASGSAYAPPAARPRS